MIITEVVSGNKVEQAPDDTLIPHCDVVRGQTLAALRRLRIETNLITHRQKTVQYVGG